MPSPTSLRSCLVLVVLLATACATTRGPEETLDPVPSAAALLRSPDSYRDRTFGFGGEIVSLLQTDHRTLIEVELLAFDRHGRLRVPRQAIGRVFLRTEKKLPSDAYVPGRGVVGAARFAGVSEAVVDGETVSYPLFELLDHRVVRDLAAERYPRFHLGLGFSFGL